MKDVRLSGKVVSFSRLSIATSDFKIIKNALQKLTGVPEPHSFGIPVILEASVELNLIELKKILAQYGLQLMAVIDGVLNAQAQQLQVTILPAEQAPPKIADTNTPEVDNHAEISQEVLRTGQQLVNQKGDVLLFADMNSGSEIISVGSVAVKGTARGRIIAGASGNQKSTITCNKLKVELVSIAGTYCLSEDIPAEFNEQATHIYIGEAGELVFAHWQG